MPPLSGPAPLPAWPRFHAAVLANQHLLDRLCAAPDLLAFRREVLAIATELGIEAYNILEGFEGDADENGHRGRKGGWRFRGLPWRQN